MRWMNELLNELGSIIGRMLFSDKRKTGNLQAEGNYVDEWSKVYGMKFILLGPQWAEGEQEGAREKEKEQK